MKFLFCVLMLSACVSEQPNQSTTASHGKERVVCTEETPTGDLIPRKVCRTVEQRDREKDAADDYVGRPTSSTSKSR